MYHKCPQCQELAVGEPGDAGEEGIIACENCGLVLSETELRPEVEFVGQDGSTTTIGNVVNPIYGSSSRDLTLHKNRLHVHDSQYTPAKSHVLGLCREITSLLRLTKRHEEQIVNTTMKAMKEKWRTGKISRLIVAACAAIVCKQDHKPVSLLDIADQWQCNVFTLGRVYTKIVGELQLNLPDVDPVVYVERACSNIGAIQGNETRVKIQSQAVQILCIAKNEWLVSGRKTTPITAAAITLALEANELKIPLKEVSENLKVSTPTAKQRLGELKVAMLELGKKLLPWGKDLTAKNIVKYIPNILQLHKIQQPSHDSAVSSFYQELEPRPPSLNRNEEKREERRLKIDRAKLRIMQIAKQDNRVAAMVHHLVPSDEVNLPINQVTDEEDRLIEKLLLANVDERLILDGYYTEEYSQQQCSNDEELTEQDIPEEELSKYIRSKEEVKMWQQLEEEKKRLLEDCDRSKLPPKRQKKVHSSCT